MDAKPARRRLQKITGAYNLPCKYIIHTVGPVWHGGGHREAERLANCYKNSLQLAKDHGIRSIAFPSISTGVYSYFLDEATDIAVRAASEFVSAYPDAIDEIIWVLFDAGTKAAYDKALDVLGAEISVDDMNESDNGTNDPVMVGFFHENEAYGYFSNWYPAEFDYTGRHFANSEQFMMYHKVLMFHKYDLADQIMRTSDPAKCKKIAGQKFPEFNFELWEKTGRTIVKRGVKAKFSQNADILKTLLGTGNTLLAECLPYDKKWATTREWSDAQRESILSGFRPKYNGKTIQGHHTYSAGRYPHLANRGEVFFSVTFDEHLYGWHGGNFKNSLPGKPISYKKKHGFRRK